MDCGQREVGKKRFSPFIEWVGRAFYFSSLLLTLDRNSCVNKLLVHLLFLWAGDRGGGSASDATLRLNYGLICGLDLGLSATIFLYTVQRGTWLNL